MRDYPPEYDEYQAVEIKVGDMPDWMDAIYWGEDGKVFGMLKNRDLQYPFGEAEDEDAAVQMCAEHLKVYWDTKAALYKRYYAVERYVRDKKPSQTWGEFWDDIKDAYDGDFDKPDTMFFDVEEAGDWEPWYCSTCRKYHLAAYSYGYGRDEDGELFIKVGTCDQDGDWNYDYNYESDAEYAMKLMETDQYFLRWAAYYLHCFETYSNHLEDLRSCTDIADYALLVAENLDYITKEI